MKEFTYDQSHEYAIEIACKTALYGSCFVRFKNDTVEVFEPSEILSWKVNDEIQTAKQEINTEEG